MPDAVSDQARDVLHLWQGSVLTALAVGALVWTLIVVSLVRFRRRNDDLPGQAVGNARTELAYTAVPVLIVALLFAFTVSTQERVTAVSSTPDLEVEVVGFQWSWEFRYPDQGVVVRSDGVDVPRLVLPVGATVRLSLTTRDVNHSFWVPEFLMKRDLIAGVDNHVDVTPRQEGVWRGRCAEFCGLYHWRMPFDVASVPRSEFDRWVGEQQGAA
jgi:cytochrome c oxidase subunit 2